MDAESLRTRRRRENTRLYATSDLGVLILSVKDCGRDDNVSDTGLEESSAEVGDGPLCDDTEDRGYLVNWENEASIGAGFGFLMDGSFFGGKGSASQASVGMFHTVETNFATSFVVAVDVSRKFALETVMSDFDDCGVRLGVLTSGFAPRLGPPICVNGKRRLLLGSTIWATLMRSTPINFCRANTVGKCSGGYSSRRYRISE